MADFQKLLERIKVASHSKLPFVAYRKPNSETVKTFFQNNDGLNYTVQFSESGFVFAPFKNQNKAIIFLESECDFVEAPFNSKETSRANSKDQKITEQPESKKQHVDLVNKGVDAIHASNLEKVVLSRFVETQTEKSPTDLFEDLLNIYSTAMVYLWHHPKVGTWLGATPETLIAVRGQRFKTMALAGTQPFENTTDVSWKSKDIEEQQIVTQVILKDLESTSQSLNASIAKTVMAGKLLHLQTKIEGLFKRGVSLSSVLKSLHPTPAVCGYPKDLAKNFILENEGYNREYYTGFFGEINLSKPERRSASKRNIENTAYRKPQQSSHLFVNLRCLQLKGNNVLIYVGGGITKDSTAEVEWQETVSKSQTMSHVL